MNLHLVSFSAGVRGGMTAPVSRTLLSQMHAESLNFICKIRPA